MIFELGRHLNPLRMVVVTEKRRVCAFDPDGPVHGNGVHLRV